MARQVAGRTTQIAPDGAVRIRYERLRARVVRGPDVGREVEVGTEDVGIGSHPSNPLALSDSGVSRFHARLVVGPRGVRLLDLDSANGTRIAGLAVRDVYVTDGLVVELGDSAIELRGAGAPAEEDLLPIDHFGELFGRAPEMQRLFAMARRAAAASATVLILGETGTGKDLLARAIHAGGPRTGRPFVVFDCGAIAPSLIEGALFGHVRGAFTGADVDRPGVFELAHGGTLFLDEIGELPLALQPKLLRALETGMVQRLGAPAPVAVDVRIMAATHRDLRAEIESERFRADLYYRLAVVALELPPLRERADDIPILAAHFARSVLARAGGDLTWLLPHLDDAFGALRRYAWPGNVRELRNAVERAIALADPTALAGDPLSRLVELRHSLRRTRRGRLPLETARAEFDREYLRDLLTDTAGDLRAGAELAGVHPKSLERLLRRYHLRDGER
ncbi:MAG: sigma 54-dependent Fis family transcriptional regulator [Kofleriaceae bacterium]|nr:sigma 54-dependent Fis family transcriptional regulator [Kofleriaceae bacterium]MBP9170891.1 sigma 54-dependent Fis family transcriptional regulator [Kofleriaceae bacterium]MBP9861290.1 sigma 54-dependent Fis family transcriptional regulator [Kofleriaceae bacterium]